MHTYMKIFKKDQSCLYRGNLFENTEHFFLFCPKYAIKRKTIFLTVHNFIIPVSVEILLL